LLKGLHIIEMRRSFYVTHFFLLKLKKNRIFAEIFTQQLKHKIMSCENVTTCTCPKTTCPNYKKCCDCVKQHVNLGGLPHCLRPENRN